MERQVHLEQLSKAEKYNVHRFVSTQSEQFYKNKAYNTLKKHSISVFRTVYNCMKKHS